MLKRFLKSILWVILFLILGFVFLNFPFFWFQVNRIFKGHTTSYNFASTNQNAQTYQANYLYIKSLNISAPIVFITKKDDATYEDALQQGVVHFPETALPGASGNCYIFGHSSDYIWRKGEYKTVFAPLPEIVVGDEIIVTNSAGEVFNYKVTKTFVTGPDDVSVLDQEGGLKHILTLQTSYPLGTALKRFIVRAEMIN